MRFATLNLWGSREPLVRRLEVAADGLRALEPDVICLQEVRVGEGLPHTGETLAALLGSDWQTVFAAGTSGGPGTFGPGSTAGEEGVAILSRHPVRETRTVALPEARPDERRVLLSALIEGAGPVWAHTTHLHYRLGDGLARERQVLAIDAAIRELPTEPVHVLGGDFNAAPDCDEIRFLCGRHTLDGRRTYWQDAFRVARPDERGWTWARRNPMTEHLAWLERDRRIDYLFVKPERRDGRGRVLDARVFLDAPADDGTWGSDHFGLMAEIEVD
jgi:endonuclease/exonuclease/phosphatase family metal-dependent hydrolase